MSHLDSPPWSAVLSPDTGFRIRPDFSARKLYFEVYKGADRTSSSAAKVIFSEKYDNLLNESYSYDSTNYRTKAFVSQLINDVRVAYSVGSGTGLDLREFDHAIIFKVALMVKKYLQSREQK